MAVKRASQFCNNPTAPQADVTQRAPPPPLDAPRPACYSNLVKYEPCLHIVLHQPEIPHNTGSVGRTCVAVGAKLWLVRPLGFRVDDYYLRRAGLDYWEHLEWEVTDDWPSLVARLDNARFWLFTKTATRPYAEVQFARGDVFVFGSESSGLPASILDQHRDRTLRIPIRSAVRSLNLSNAAAVAMYEALRQWNVRSSPLDGERPGEGCPPP